MGMDSIEKRIAIEYQMSYNHKLVRLLLNIKNIEIKNQPRISCSMKWTPKTGQ